MDKNGDCWQRIPESEKAQKCCRNMEILLLDFFEKAWYNNKAVGREQSSKGSEKHATLGKMNSLETFLRMLVKKNFKRNFEKPLDKRSEMWYNKQVRCQAGRESQSGVGT